MARSIPILTGHFYHIYNRGNNRAPIFLESENYFFFIQRLHKYFSKGPIDLLAYCLMPNHFHLLVTFQYPVDFSNLMRSFSSSYAKSFNRFYNRTGHLFEGDYQAKVIEKESYLRNVICYIHLNPCFAGLASQPEDWQYSDYRQWLKDQPASGDHSIQLRDALFGSGLAYKEFVKDFSTAIAEQKEIEKYLGLET